MDIKTAESAGRKATRKTVGHIEIHPRMGGGHTIRHVYRGFGHEPYEANFTKQQAHQAAAHVSKHTGLPLAAEHQAESKTEDEIVA